jgi:hypothetical protein
MIDVNKLRGRMAERGRSGLDMAKVIGKTPKPFYLKMKAGVFDSDEIEAMVRELDITNPLEIFFAEEVT